MFGAIWLKSVLLSLPDDSVPFSNKQHYYCHLQVDCFLEHKALMACSRWDVFDSSS